MVPLNLLIDLNELPYSPISSSPISPTSIIATPSTGNLIAPKIEPKAEPLDDWSPKLLSNSSTFPITKNARAIFSQTVNRSSPAVSAVAAGAIVPAAVATTTTTNSIAPKNYPKAEPLGDWNPITGNARVRFSQTVNGSSPAVSAAAAGAIVPAVVANTTTTNSIGPKIVRKAEALEYWNPYRLSNPTLNLALADPRYPQATLSATPRIGPFRFAQTPSWKFPEVDAASASAGAIVPAAVAPAPAPLPKRQKRRLIRFNQINTPKAFNYHLDSVRKTRILYESLRLFDMLESEKHIVPPFTRRMRSDLRASTFLRHCNFWLHPGKKVIGSVPGISIGDIFLFRMEMCVLGLHGQPQAGIDYLTGNDSESGHPVATSIIVSGGYEGDIDKGKTLIYSGHGGRARFNRSCCDQRFEGGNLALFNSWLHCFEIRVIRGLRRDADGPKVYVYDGLYKITNAWADVGKSGFRVYKFRLRRFKKQGKMGSRRMRLASFLRANPLKIRPNGYLSLDLSSKKEKVPVYLFNDIDSDDAPMQFEYLPSAVFPASVYQAPGGTTGCPCIGGCSFDCLCVTKNGGEIPYDKQGLLVRGKPVVFECGVSCKCPPDCRNRVSQRGLSRRLEVFKAEGGEWRVRALEVIQPGSFVCEYSGLAVDKEQARIFSMAGDRLTYPGQFAPKWVEWGDLSLVFPARGTPSFPSLPPLDFAIDTSTLRNVAFYMGHSSCPNLMTQFVMYDHNNMMFPRVMLFALETIPPMRELTIDYGTPDERTRNLAICHR